MTWNHLVLHFDRIFVDPNSRFAWFWLIETLVVAAVFYYFFRKKSLKTLWKNLFSKEVLLSPSAYVDLVVFSVYGFGLIALLTSLEPYDLYRWGLGAFSIHTPGLFPHAADLLIIKFLWTFLRMIAGEIGYYAYHRLMHTKYLWHFHAVHHSATHLNFLTAYRMHPVDLLISNLILGLAGGLFALFTLFLFGKQSISLLIFGFVFIIPFRAVVANLRHSHVWWCFPDWLSRIFMSPAQHQVHHCTNEIYVNKNFTNDVAFIDLMFGTLHIPKEEEEADLKFGIDNAAHNFNPGSLKSFMIQPFINLKNHLVSDLSLIWSNKWREKPVPVPATVSVNKKSS